jgi:hypothetical protein
MEIKRSRAWNNSGRWGTTSVRGSVKRKMARVVEALLIVVEEVLEILL